MPIPSQAFINLPELEHLIIQPEDSVSRIDRNRVEEFDRQALEEGWPHNWRLSHSEREQNRKNVLRSFGTKDLWVFAYGSLMWDPGLYFDNVIRALAVGWSRRFSLRILGNRATREKPGLMAALEEGGCCQGLALRIPAKSVDVETDTLWMREMIAGTYEPVFLDVETKFGTLSALTFAISQKHERYAGNISDEKAASIIASAEGSSGTNFDYLEILNVHLNELGIFDPYIARLYELARSQKNISGPVDISD